MTDLQPLFESIVMEFRQILLSRDSSAAIFLGVGGRTISPLLPPQGAHPTDALLTLARAAQAGDIPRPDWAALCSDSYGELDPKRAPKRGEWERGTLAARFAAGDPNVYECAMVSMMHEDGTQLMGMQKYTRRHLKAINREVIDFGEFERWDVVEGATLDGAVPDALKLFLGLV